MPATQIKRDPFARASLMRRVVSPDDVAHAGNSCANCGGLRKNHSLFQYFWEGDSEIRIFGSLSIANGKLFCCVGCYRSYMEED
jgi:hypothetical protein